MDELIDVPAGLAGVAVADTEIGDVLGQRGYYHYRGQPAPELAASSSFEEVASLVLCDSSEPLRSDRALPDGVRDIIGRLDLRTALSATFHALELGPLVEIDEVERLAQATRLVSVFPTVVASAFHGEPVEPDVSLGHVEDFLRMLTGARPSEAHTRVAESWFVAMIDHGFNNSTFATRVVASTGADLGACVVAGFGSLSGPWHGAHVERMLEIFDDVAAFGEVDDWMRNEISQGRRIQGFGHAVYEKDDPRLVLMRELGATVAPDRHVQAMAYEIAGTEILRGRRLVPNVDLHSPVVLEGLGVPRGWFLATMATARVVAWCAHAVEQAEQKRIIRPSARYVGPPPVDDIY